MYLEKFYIRTKLEKNELDFPEDADLPHTSTKIPFIVVGDEAFPLRKKLMRPYPGTGLSCDQRIFNFRLSRARITVENAFSIMSARFRVFRRPICIEPTKVDVVVKACVVLHNFLRSNVASTSATQESQPLSAGLYAFLCKVRISRTKSLAIRKRHLSRDSTFGLVRRAFQSKGLLLAVDLEDGRVLRRGTHSPTLAVTTWLIVS